MSRSRGKPPSQRQLRVGEEIRHCLARVLMQGEAHDPELQDVSVTVSEVRLSPDLKNATAFVMPLGGSHSQEAIKALNRAAPFFRHRLAEEVDLRFTPRLSFQLDQSFDEASRIDALLNSPRVRGDLADGPDTAPREDDDGAPS